jgi:hypothetical protein
MHTGILRMNEMNTQDTGTQYQMKMKQNNVPLPINKITITCLKINK